MQCLQTNKKGKDRELPVLSLTGQPQRQPQAVNNQIIEQLMHAEEQMRIFRQEELYGVRRSC